MGAYAVEAVRATGDLKTLVGDGPGAAALYALHARMVAAYNGEYWDAAAGHYRDWVDVDGTPRTYLYLWQQYAAIEFGIANASQAATILDTIDAAYAQVAAAHNVSADALWCTPTNLRPASPDDLTLDFDGEYVFPAYENGDCFHWHAGLEALARGRVRGGDAAFARFTGVLAEFNTSRLWGQRYSWLHGAPAGFDVITDGLFALYGGLLGSLGLRTSLFGGVTSVGPAAAALEGASFTFGLGGVDVTVDIKGGRAVVRQPPPPQEAPAPPPVPPQVRQ